MYFNASNELIFYSLLTFATDKTMKYDKLMRLFKKEPTYDSPLSKFMRNGSAAEHKRVFKKVIENSIKAQQKVIDLANQMDAAETEQHVDSGSRGGINNFSFQKNIRLHNESNHHQKINN